MRAPVLCREANISYRQLDWWVRCGYLEPVLGDACPGSGVPREFDADDLFVAKVIAELAALGVGLRQSSRAAYRLLARPQLRGFVYVTKAGDISDEPCGSCWVLDADALATMAVAR